MNTPVRVVVAGGGTAGHVYPGLAVAEELRSAGHDVRFLGTETGLEARLVPAAGFPFEVLNAKPLVRKFSLRAAEAPMVAARAVRACRPLVRGADVILGMGGYVSVPAVLAARREGIPVVVHEQNAVPGLANRTFARLRVPRTIALSFAEAVARFPPSSRTVVTGNPVRRDILEVPRRQEELAEQGREELELDPDRRTVVIFGGSQGALHIDRAAIGAARLMGDRADLQLVLITGPAHLEIIRRGIPPAARPLRGWPGASIEAAPPDGRSGDILSVAGGAGGLGVRLVGYLERMELAYAVADLVVCRAGATSVAEVSSCGLPALLVPYPFATARHQLANARAMQRAGAASMLRDDELSAGTLAERITNLVDHDERLAAMRDRSRSFGKPEAGRVLAGVVTSEVKHRP